MIEIKTEKGYVRIIKNNYELVNFNLSGHKEYDLGAVMDFLKKIIEKSLKEEE